MRTSKLGVLAAFTIISFAACKPQPKALINSSRFHVDFGGAVVHVFGGINRAVALKLGGHTPLVITSPLDSASQLRLTNDLHVPFKCDSDACVIEGTDLRLRIVASEGGEIRPAMNKDQTIDLQVPHLRDIALDKVNHPFNRVSDDVIANEPQGDVAAMFDYTGGTFRSEPFKACKGEYDPPVGIQQKDFTAGVTLDGFTTSPALLEVSSKSHPAAVTLSFVKTNEIAIGFGSVMFMSGCQSHLQQHYVAAYDKAVTLPRVKTSGCQCMLGLAPGCSNTQWP